MKVIYTTELYHHGVKGQKWGVRRYQNPDGTLTKRGAKRLYKESVSSNREKNFYVKKADKFAGEGASVKRVVGKYIASIAIPAAVSIGLQIAKGVLVTTSTGGLGVGIAAVGLALGSVGAQLVAARNDAVGTGAIIRTALKKGGTISDKDQELVDEYKRRY